MRKLTGYALAAAGFATAAWFWLPADTEKIATERLATLVKIASESSRPASSRQADRQATFVASVASTDQAAIAARAPAEPIVVAQGPLVGEATGGTAIPSIAPTARSFGNVKPSDDTTRKDLARSIQTELKRVGCFDGDIDGNWSSKTRGSMKAFTDRVNASLPVEEPDYILLTLLQGHTNRACGNECPTGQAIARDGRCLPRSVIASTDRKSPQRRTKGDTQEPASVAPAPKASQALASVLQTPADDVAASEAQRNQQAALEERQARLEAERKAKLRASEELRRKQALTEQQRADAEKLRTARLEIEQQLRAKALEEERLKHTSASQQKPDAEAQRQAKLGAERVAKTLATEEARQRQAALEQQRAEAKAETERQRIAKVEADRLARTQAAEEARQKRAALEQQKAEAKANAERQRLAEIAALKQAASSAATAAGASASALSASSLAASSMGHAQELPLAASSVPAEAAFKRRTSASQKSEPTGPDANRPPAAPQVALAPAPGPSPASVTEEESEEPGPIRRSSPSPRPAPSRVAALPPPAPRFVQRFVPPPLYVGRLAPPSRPFVFRQQQAARDNFRFTLFSSLSRGAP